MTTQEPCPRIEALSALIDDELRESERLALQAHVAGCEICAPVLAELRQLRTRFAALPTEMPAFDLAPEVDRRIEASTVPPPSRRVPRLARSHWRHLVMLAPGGAVAVAAGLWLGTALMPATLASATAPAAQMAAFSTMPPGALCPLSNTCGRPNR